MGVTQNKETIEDEGKKISIKKFIIFLVITYFILYTKSGYPLYVIFKGNIFAEILGALIGVIIIPALFIGFYHLIGFMRNKPKKYFLFKLIIGMSIITVLSIFTERSKYFEHPLIGFILLGIEVFYIFSLWNEPKIIEDSTDSPKEEEKNSVNNKICKTCKKGNTLTNNFCIYCGQLFIKKASDEKKLEEEIKIYNQIIKEYDGVLVALLAKVAKVDGKICKDEASYISKIYDELSKSRQNIPNIRNIYKQILNNEKTNLDNIKLLCSYLQYSSQESSKISLLKILVELAYIDKEYSKEEENLIVKVVYILNIDFSIYKEIIAKFEKDNTSNNTSSSNKNHLTLNECYELLQSSPNSTHQDIKKNYRKLVRQYHTDMLQSKDLPSDMIHFAEEKLKQINMAYEKIKKYRGLK